MGNETKGGEVKEDKVIAISEKLNKLGFVVVSKEQWDMMIKTRLIIRDKSK